MLTPRNVIALVISLAVFSLAWSVISLFAEPDSDGRAADSYGTRIRGHRAIFESLDELGIAVRRSIEPPDPDSLGNATLVFWNPKAEIVRLEPVWLAGLREWVENGGRVVVATAPEPSTFGTKGAGTDEEEENPQLPGPQVSETTILEHLGAGAVSIVSIDPSDSPDQPSEDVGNGVEIRGEKPDKPEQDDMDPAKALHLVLDWQAEDEVPVRFPFQAKGSLQSRFSDVDTIELPLGELAAIEATPIEPDGRGFITDASGTERCIAARFEVGEGEVIAVSTPRLISNANLGQADNSVAAMRLFAVDGRDVVFDEFYHGLAIRGNPMWLFSQRAYGTIVLAVLLLAGLSVWRHAVFLGPPLDESPPVRRSVSEYVEAMARFFCESRQHGRFIVEQVRDGMLWSLRREHRLPPEKHTLTDVLAIVSHRDPDRAERIRNAFAHTEALLETDSHVELKRSAETLRQLTECLSHPRQVPVPMRER